MSGRYGTIGNLARLLGCSVAAPYFKWTVDSGYSETGFRQRTGVKRLLRDTLLPKLISGELRIPDAEKLAEAALA